MTVSEYLKLLEAQQKNVDELRAKAYRLQAICEKCTTTISAMPKGAGTSGKEDTYIRLAEAQAEYNTAKAILREMQKPLCAVDDDMLRKLLVYRYVCGWQWEKVAARLGRTVDMTRNKLHYRALSKINLQNIEKILAG